MKRILLARAFVALTLAANAQINDIPRSTPEEQGVPSKALIELFSNSGNDAE